MESGRKVSESCGFEESPRTHSNLPKNKNILMNPGILSALEKMSMVVLDTGSLNDLLKTVPPTTAETRGSMVLSPNILTPLRKVIGMADPGKPLNDLAMMEMERKRCWLAVSRESKKSRREKALLPLEIGRDI